MTPLIKPKKPSLDDDTVKKVTYNIVIGDFSIAKDVIKMKEMQQGEKPKHLTDEQWQKWIETGDKILNNIL